MNKVSAEINVPAIRFKGFSGEWDNEALGANADFSKGQGYSKSDLVSEGRPIILYGRLYTQYQTIISEVNTFVVGATKSIISKGNEVIVPASGETAEDISRASAVIKSGILLGGDLNIIYPNNKLNSIFLALTISNGKPQNDLSKRAQGKSVVHIRNNDLKEVDISYPDFTEQTQIGNYFQQLDTLIAQHQQKHDKLLNLKKALLEKMFPKQSATVPEIRLKGFSEEWEVKTLGGFVSNISDGDWIESNHIFEQGKYRIIQTGNLGVDGEYIDKENNAKYFHQKDFDEIRANEIFPGDILISRLAEPAGRTIILAEFIY